MAAFFSSDGTELDDVVGVFDHVEVVFDDDDGVPFINEFLKDIEKFLYVVAMESCCGLIHGVEGAAGLPFGELTAEFDSLRFTA